ncbi:uncharacterized protein EI97DRAFT_72338 [Westerdykella ornata]|uniref:Uncharacterized protein n=1 Tax=Westerdykella ornata TaxID=318751 RepID=A0A6A6JGV3_WESOR|nr:uncharacterized protein EI97DRAFT_72338 [Westerdykella ornata]KAF2275333.1 hypothetical protein EI97DRAFT_72338 [Westerdykella ornata]
MVSLKTILTWTTSLCLASLVARSSPTFAPSTAITGSSVEAKSWHSMELTPTPTGNPPESDVGSGNMPQATFKDTLRRSESDERFPSSCPQVLELYCYVFPHGILGLFAHVLIMLSIILLAGGRRPIWPWRILKEPEWRGIFPVAGLSAQFAGFWSVYAWIFLWNCKASHGKKSRLLILGLPTVTLPLLCLLVVFIRWRAAYHQVVWSQENNGVPAPKDRKPLYLLFILGCLGMTTIVGLQWLFENGTCPGHLWVTNGFIAGGALVGFLAGLVYCSTPSAQELCRRLQRFRNWPYGLIKVLFIIFWSLTGALIGATLVAIAAADILVTMRRGTKPRYAGVLNDIEAPPAAKIFYFITMIWMVLPVVGLPAEKVFWPLFWLWRSRRDFGEKAKKVFQDCGSSVVRGMRLG